MKLKVYGGGATFNVRIDGTDNVLAMSKGLTAYETAHELASWLELVTEPPAAEAPAEVLSIHVEPAPELPPAPAIPATIPTEPTPALAVIPAPVVRAPTEDAHPVAAPEGEKAS